MQHLFSHRLHCCRFGNFDFAFVGHGFIDKIFNHFQRPRDLIGAGFIPGKLDKVAVLQESLQVVSILCGKDLAMFQFDKELFGCPLRRPQTETMFDIMPQTIAEALVELLYSPRLDELVFGESSQYLIRYFMGGPEYPRDCSVFLRSQSIP